MTIFFVLLLVTAFAIAVTPTEIQLMTDAAGNSIGTSYSYNVKTVLQRFFSSQGYNNRGVAGADLTNSGYDKFLQDMASRQGLKPPTTLKGFQTFEERLFNNYKKPAPAPGMTDVQPVSTTSGGLRYTLESKPIVPKARVSGTRVATSRAPAPASASASASSASNASASTIPAPPVQRVDPVSLSNQQAQQVNIHINNAGGPTSTGTTPTIPDPVVKPVPTELDPIKPVPTELDPVKPVPTELDPVKPKPLEPDPVKPKPLEPDPVVEPAKPGFWAKYGGMLFYVGATGLTELIIEKRSGGTLGESLISGGLGLVDGAINLTIFQIINRGVVWSVARTAAGKAIIASGGKISLFAINPYTIGLVVATVVATIGTNYADEKNWKEASNIYLGIVPLQIQVSPASDNLLKSAMAPLIDPKKNLVMAESTNYKLTLKVPANSRFLDRKYSADWNPGAKWNNGEYVLFSNGVFEKVIKGMELYDYSKANQTPTWERVYRSALGALSMHTSKYTSEITRRSNERASSLLRQNLIHGASFYVTGVDETGVLTSIGDGACEVTVAKKEVYCDLRELNLTDDYYLFEVRVNYNKLELLENMTSEKNKDLENSACELYPNDTATDWYKELNRTICLSGFYDFEKNEYTPAAIEKINLVKADLEKSINELDKLPSTARDYLARAQAKSGSNYRTLLNQVDSTNTDMKYSMNALVAGYPIHGLLIVGNPPTSGIFEEDGSSAQQTEYIDVNPNGSILYYIKVLNKKIVKESLGVTVVIRTATAPTGAN
jgi:hypothetical protein